MNQWSAIGICMIVASLFGDKKKLKRKVSYLDRCRLLGNELQFCLKFFTIHSIIKVKMCFPPWYYVCLSVTGTTYGRSLSLNACLITVNSLRDLQLSIGSVISYVTYMSWEEIIVDGRGEWQLFMYLDCVTVNVSKNQLHYSSSCCCCLIDWLSFIV